MNDPNRNVDAETLQRLQEESFERLQINLYNAVADLLQEFNMTWDDLAFRLSWDNPTSEWLRYKLGCGMMTLREFNQIANCFSCDIHLIFKPRFPYTNT